MKKSFCDFCGDEGEFMTCTLDSKFELGKGRYYSMDEVYYIDICESCKQKITLMLKEFSASFKEEKKKEQKVALVIDFPTPSEMNEFVRVEFAGGGYIFAHYTLIAINKNKDNAPEMVAGNIKGTISDETATYLMTKLKKLGKKRWFK